MIFQHRWKELMLTEKLAHIQDKKTMVLIYVLLLKCSTLIDNNRAEGIKR